ncbi:Teneurin-4 [Hondaea fermentalgiana]|uniref:Teneurin-4 n=1 Tax=Hondaea fermentalgiana TaxID=2315210 RepID=A0A2R5GT81_9STRA|nr:Teneurin-4 [Hondaea fermentalgiana]|eukprot:GBG34050.1 Teneurin-4 [Hondaea fermentalgiana]
MTDKAALSCELIYPDLAWSFGSNPFGPCSGHGTCVNGTCICDAGWTGRSDWMNAEGIDCQIHMPTVKALYGILALAQVVGYIMAIPYLKSRYAAYLSLKDLHRRRGESYSMRHNKTVLAMAIWYLVGAPMLFLYCLVKWTANEERVGVTWGLTILFVVVKLLFYLCVLLTQPTLLRAVLHDLQKGSHYVRINDRMTVVMYAGQLLSGLLAVAAVLKPDAQQTIYIIYLVVMLYVAGWISGQAFFIKARVIHTLDRSHRVAAMPKMLVLKDKLVAMQNSAIRQGALLAILFLIQLVWPFLWTKHDYYLPLSWLVMPIVGMRVAKTAFSEKDQVNLNSSRSSASTGGIQRGSIVANYRVQDSTGIASSNPISDTATSEDLQPPSRPPSSKK